MVGLFEPHVSGMLTDDFIWRSDFDCSHRVEANGFSGGLWILWKSTVTFQVLAVSNLFVHGICTSTQDCKSFYVTFVYASPHASSRRRLWGDLRALEPDMGWPWVVRGDLNVIGSVTEMQGGSSKWIGICKSLCDFMLESGLIDMGFSGPRFTWSRGTLSQRLDMCLGNNAWFSAFVNSAVTHLSKFDSDHRPILLETRIDDNLWVNRPFRYLSAWNEHPDFKSLLAGVWIDERSIHENLLNFQLKSKEWNREVFGHIGRRKSLLLARLQGIEIALENSQKQFLENLELDLKKELSEVLNLEESLWHQKARTQWIEKGDRNTVFFHAATMVRCRRNRISGLRLPNGGWCQDSNGLKQHVVSFFKKLFTSEPRQLCWDWRGSDFKQFNQSELRSLLREVTMEEVREIVFSMAPLKALGPDGIHVEFYQKNWDRVRNSVFHFVKEFF
ncbi:hypothetical protein HRI_001773800 [Hibiscus trionum]|uniref:Reverse transcriptase n=1 Tax=Hibiscus trionum TaxID=183268 RepID=A0A9W7HNC3_HIBTR|nr:hypothetical protein HRI_001773800 [Hibiscus trionum]